MLLKTFFCLICSAVSNFTTRTALRDFKILKPYISEFLKSAEFLKSKCCLIFKEDKYRNYWVLINAFWIRVICVNIEL